MARSYGSNACLLAALGLWWHKAGAAALLSCSLGAKLLAVLAQDVFFFGEMQLCKNRDWELNDLSISLPPPAWEAVLGSSLSKR